MFITVFLRDKSLKRPAVAIKTNFGHVLDNTEIIKIFEPTYSMSSRHTNSSVLIGPEDIVYFGPHISKVKWT